MECEKWPCFCAEEFLFPSSFQCVIGNAFSRLFDVFSFSICCCYAVYKEGEKGQSLTPINVAQIFCIIS